MTDRYRESWLKIERAKEHIENLNSILKTFLNSDFYGITIERDADGTNFLAIEIDASKFESDRCALVIGDALHNLRSALDLFFYINYRGPWTSFPIADTREKLITRIDKRIKQKQITESFRKFVLDTVKPYQAGNFFLWILHYLNNWDKHQLLIPVIQGMEFREVRLQDDKNNVINWKTWYYSPHSTRIPLAGTEGRNVTLNDKGHATATIFFNFEAGILNQSVTQTLTWIAEEVTRTIKAFELLGIGGTS